MQFTERNTEDYYDNFSGVYENVWNEQIHTGYFDKEKSLEQAVEDMDAFLAREIQLKDNSFVVVIGSGRGGTDRFLAKSHSCRVIGIDLSKTQISVAKKRAKAEGLNIEYLQASMESIPLLDKIADYIWIQESFFHCHDKQKAVSEFTRLLKPNGVVIMEDTLLFDINSRAEVLEKFGQRVSINEILTSEEYVDLFKQVGLTLVKKIDLSSHLLKTYKAIIEHIKQNREKIREVTPARYRGQVDSNFGFPRSLKLVEEGKLGCAALYFSSNFVR